MALTREQEVVAVDLMARVRSLLVRCEREAATVETARDYLPSEGWGIPGLELLEVVRDLLGNDTQAQVVGAMREVADRVPRWIGPDGAKYKWLVRGTRDDGTPYPFGLWLDEGNAIASTLATALHEVHEASTWTVIERTVDATEEELAAAGRAVVDTVASIPEAVTGPWSWQTKLLLGGVGVVALLGAAGAASMLWQANRASPVGLALRGAGLAVRVGARPLNNAATSVGRKLAARIKQAERQHLVARPKTKGRKT
ncbi:hypothetical protein FJV41_40900 [Myxococcus llanfairpwllgwyngyllgogerychwyrndrobwllllantysiliogogogochensis]|uniref:Uncharacterized protein n=1 Tax=Myxococcus llanfairpwllgwyngyllgogerychwyrndrobwllllantysiliogogogochensis TaxID=2590453 RepID=A0A540WMC5_9BACT|nr:hypothetical protein [Myxococcus llanfairpwllgwyngyllgogerychwyrndrobwllllantysiliogogogochensis]TQF10171.1 hypothetical protein FJV41_40900 [Myxococcus llanfairpwllgwyngyllgogerychwyrndrobwllllantysiliogogogochensis]